MRQHGAEERKHWSTAELAYAWQGRRLGAVPEDSETQKIENGSRLCSRQACAKAQGEGTSEHVGLRGSVPGRIDVR